LEFFRQNPAGRKSWKKLVTNTMKKNWLVSSIFSTTRGRCLTSENRASGGMVATYSPSVYILNPFHRF
jgi:hypothetical protein